MQVSTWTSANPGHLPLVIVVHPASSGIVGDVVTDAAKLHLADITLKDSNVPGPTSYAFQSAQIPLSCTAELTFVCQ